MEGDEELERHGPTTWRRLGRGTCHRTVPVSHVIACRVDEGAGSGRARQQLALTVNAGPGGSTIGVEARRRVGQQGKADVTNTRTFQDAFRRNSCPVNALSKADCRGSISSSCFRSMLPTPPRRSWGRVQLAREGMSRW